ncbi:hypothetical protein [Streptomyces sp. NPDC088400]|uniref:hypothetical protein n=1 Tax=Streptomyces sp. NPDC088400 TaxID=3365861 RepID=UPI00380747CB
MSFVVTFSAVAAGTAVADGNGTAQGLTLVSIGQIDDPMEDVLEHFAVFGGSDIQN